VLYADVLSAKQEYPENRTLAARGEVTALQEEPLPGECGGLWTGRVLLREAQLTLRGGR